MHARKALLKAILLAWLSVVVKDWADATGLAKIVRNLMYGACAILAEGMASMCLAACVQSHLAHQRLAQLQSLAVQRAMCMPDAHDPNIAGCACKCHMFCIRLYQDLCSKI